jgi:branched-subunit amino acid aminotransferase/4-amino-4-deoxychorismate lyase
LKIRLPFTPDALRGFAGQLIAQNQMPDSLLRLTLSRGVGVRGYSPKGAESPSLVMSLHSAPAMNSEGPVHWRLVTSSFRLPANEPLAQYKTCNKLAQILARGEADAAGADEALLLNTDNHVVEGASSNLFWIEDQTVCTPPLASGILAGVTRSVVLEICAQLGLETRERNVTSAELKGRQGVFVSLSSWGVVEAKSLDGGELESSAIVERLRFAYSERVCVETA